MLSRLQTFFCLPFLCAACLLAFAPGARANTIISVGYYDLAPPTAGNTNALPNPWYGSSNTTFLGSSAQATLADPDEAAILFTNTGATAVTLNQGVTVTSGASSFTLWDSLIGAGGFSIAPGHSVILSGTIAKAFDGSDIPLLASTISFSLNGTAFSFVDTGNILNGSPIGSANETEPWTQIGDISSNINSTPDPSSILLLSINLLGAALIGLGWKLRKSGASSTRQA